VEPRPHPRGAPPPAPPLCPPPRPPGAAGGGGPRCVPWGGGLGGGGRGGPPPAGCPPPPPLAATSRDTVETALPTRAAITVNDSPPCRPRVISSRSARVSRPGPGTQPSSRTGRREPSRPISATVCYTPATSCPISRTDQP